MATMKVNQQEILTTAEDIADKVLKQSKYFLPFFARLCLVSTFLEDGFRMWFQWDDQKHYIHASWGCGWFLATFFVGFNFIGQIGGSLMMLTRFRVDYACGMLFCIVVLQTLAYTILWDLQFLLRNLSLVGALLLLFAESRSEGKTIFAGLSSLGDNKPLSYLQLTGRVLVIFMFTTVLRLELSIIYIIQNVVATSLMVLVTIGYKTKLSALLLVLWLLGLNCYLNAWWSVSSYSPMRDFLKYDFFQTLSVVGGLLMIVSLGPGGVSMDEQKKRW